MKMKKNFKSVSAIIIALIILCYSAGFAVENVNAETKENIAANGNLIITNISLTTSLKKSADSVFSVELNKNLIINCIKINGSEVEYPSKDTREYFIAESEAAQQFLKEISKAIIEFNQKKTFTGAGELKKIDVSEIQIKLYTRPSKVKAFVSILTADGFKLAGMIIKYENSAVIVDWPKSDKAEVFIFNDAENKKEIEKKIIEEFEKKAADANFDYKTGTAKKEDADENDDKKYGAVVPTQIIKNKTGKLASIVLNGVLKINNVEIGKDEVKFPENKTPNSDKSFPIIKPDRKNEAKLDEIISIIKSGKPVKTADKLEVSFVMVNKNGKFASVGFNNAFTIESFRIFEDDGISWPSVKSEKTKKYVPIIEITDKALKKAVEKAIIDKARKNKKFSGKDGKNKSYKKSYDNRDNKSKKFDKKKKAKDIDEDNEDGE